MSINPRSQPYRLDPPVDEKNLPQIVTNVDEMFQILFEDIVALDAEVDVIAATIPSSGSSSIPGPKGPPGKDGASSSSSFRVPPGRNNTDFVPYVGAVRNVNLGANSLTTPIVIGGDTTTSTLQLRTTSAVGNPGEAIMFQTGTNGSIQAMSIVNTGLVGIGVSNPTPLALYPLSIGAGTGNRVLALLTSSTTVAGTVAMDFYTQANRGWGSTIVGSNVGTGALDFYVNGAADLVLALTSGKLAGFNIAIPIANVQVKSDSTVTGNQSGLMLSVGQSTRHGGLMFNGNGLSNDTWQRIDYVFSTSDVTFDRSTDGGATWVTWMKSLYTNGNIGFGVATPTAVLHPKAGTASASSAPLKFNSGTVLTTAEAGAHEFTTDDFFLTITTGAARKGIVLDDGARLSSGKIPVASTNGRLIDGQTPLAGAKVYWVSDTSGGAVNRKLTFTNGILTAET